MKKSFFKKLSFVLALAMIVTTLAPATGAFAATTPALSTTSKTLLLGEPAAKSSFDFNFKKATLVSGCKYSWTSSNTKVAKVTSTNGLTKAVGIGTATITCKVTKKSTGKKVATVTAKVTVKDNMKTITITDPGTVAIDKATTLAYTYTTFGGATTGSTSDVKWTVDKTGATVTAGVFTATLPGTYTVTANATTSVSTNLVKATDTQVITVVPSIVSVKQVDLDTFKVTFDADMSKTDVTTGSSLYQVIAGKPVLTGTEKIKSTSLDATGKIVTFDAYGAFTQGSAYNYVYGKLTGTFTAAKVELINVTSVVFDDFDVDTSVGYQDMSSSVKAYNSDGVIIYTGSDSAFGTYLTYTYGGDFNKGYSAGSTAFLYADGNTAKISVKWEATVYDATALVFKTLTFSDDAIATAKNKDVITAGSMKFAAPLLTDATDKASLSYSATGVTVAATDNNKIAVKYTLNKDTTDIKYSTNIYNSSAFTFKSTDFSKLVIGGYVMYPVSTGTVTVLVYSGTTQVGAFDVTIVAARSFASAVQDATSVSIGNSDVDESGANVNVAIKDSMGNDATASGVTFDKIAGPTITSGCSLPTPSFDITTAGKVVLNFKGYTGIIGSSTKAQVGQYSYKVGITSLTTTKYVWVTVNVTDATSVDAMKVVSYKVELSSTAIDVKSVTDSSITVGVYGYNSAGVKVSKLLPNQYVVAVTDTSGNAPTVTSSDYDTTIPVVQSAAGQAVTSDAIGTYIVKVTAQVQLSTAGNSDYRVATALLDQKTFTLTDTTTKTINSVSPTVSASTYTTVLTAVNAAVSVAVNGTTLPIEKVDYTLGDTGIISADTGLTAGKSIYVSAVYVKVANTDTSYFLYKIDINQSITAY
jgi:hypothetical protein